MKNVIYPTCAPLTVPCDGEFLLCIPSELMISGAPFIEATLLQTVVVKGPCGDTLYHNYVEYDETELVTPADGILASQITGYIYDPCLVSYINYMISQAIPLIPT